MLLESEVVASAGASSRPRRSGALHFFDLREKLRPERSIEVAGL